MEFETNFRNRNLERRKIDLISKIRKDFISLKEELNERVNCLYHEEELSFFSKDEKLRNHFNKILPKSWLKNSSNSPHSIYIFNPENFGIDIETWQGEISQDCFIDNKQRAAIQRDFISIQIDDNQTILVCHDSMDDGFNNFMRWFLPRRLLEREVLVFHSSCVIKNERANIFLGHSGAGKSTMVSLRENRDHLSDDMNLIFKQGDSYFVQAGAIGGLFFDKVDYSKKYPIENFSWLIQDTDTYSTKLSHSKAYLKAMASVSNVFWDTLEEEKSIKIMNNVKEIVEQIDFKELHFKKDTEVWKYV